MFLSPKLFRTSVPPGDGFSPKAAGFLANGHEEVMTMSLPEEDLTCAVCCDIFSDPVLLACSHSFCRQCLKRCWESGLRECPVCRKRVAKSNVPSNLALRNVCEAVLQVKRQNSLLDEKLNCSLHGERLKLFCLDDQQPMCVVCGTSRQHKTHDSSPIDEAAQDCKEELVLCHQSLKEKLASVQRMQGTTAGIVRHIKSQALDTREVIRSHFGQLHQILHDEEAKRLAAVGKEEEEKIAGMKDKVKELSAEALAIADTISVIEEQLQEEDITMLKNFKDTLDRSKSAAFGPHDMSGLLIDVTKHVGNLKYRVWEKMLDEIDYSPVTLDPNTAHPCLFLSDDLTSLHYSKQRSGFPDNPERFHLSAEVVSMSALGSGSHHWVVETGSNQDWLLGVASVSVPRSSETLARPENGFWTLCFRDGEFRAMTSPPTVLDLTGTPQKIKVQLDYNKERLAFLDYADDTLIYAFTHKFTEPLLPYFYTQSSQPLRIMPEKVLITMLRQ